MRVPEQLKYTESHEWLRWESDGTVTVGITDFAQESLGDLVFVELPVVGRTYKAGDPCAVVESVKAASDVYAPIAGEITAVNEALSDRPEAINEDAFAAWLFRLRPSQPASGDGLLDAAQYQANVAQPK